MNSAKLQDKNPRETTASQCTMGPQLENALEETPFIMLTKKFSKWVLI